MKAETFIAPFAEPFLPTLQPKVGGFVELVGDIPHHLLPTLKIDVLPVLVGKAVCHPDRNGHFALLPFPFIKDAADRKRIVRIPAKIVAENGGEILRRLRTDIIGDLLDVELAASPLLLPEREMPHAVCPQAVVDAMRQNEEKPANAVHEPPRAVLAAELHLFIQRNAQLPRIGRIKLLFQPAILKIPHLLWLCLEGVALSFFSHIPLVRSPCRGRLPQDTSF